MTQLNIPTRRDIDGAAVRLAGRVRETPVIRVGADDFGVDVVLKLECLQHTGSFKPRGAFNRVLAAGAAATRAGLIAASGGNHGVAVAYVARALGLSAEIFVPQIIPAAKRARLQEYGARVHVGGQGYADALAASQQRQAETAALGVHAFDDFDVVAGQGSLAREMDRQAPGLDTLLVAVGGGGLIAGAAAWFDGRVKLIGVEPATSTALHSALAAGAPCDVAVSGIAADSLGARRAGNIAFALARSRVAQVVLVDDAAIAQAQRALWSALRVFAEPGGATALAALLSGAYRPAPGESVGVIVCGGNGDPASLV